MNKTLRILLVGVALIGAAAPALARGDAGGGSAGAGGDGGTSNVWDPGIAGIQIPPGRHPPTVPPRRSVTELREDTCGMHRGVLRCRVR